MSDKPDEMEKVHAARMYLDARHPVASKQRKQLELDAFMSIFHPDHKRIVLDDE